MKYIIVIGCIVCLSTACLRERYEDADCLRMVFFNMEDVPYILEGEEVAGYRPYYFFTERLDLFVFSGQSLERTVNYDYEYCRTHAVIPLVADRGERDFLFVANLYDPQNLSWRYQGNRLEGTFYIRDNQEPSLFLSAVVATRSERDTLPVNLQLQVSRLEIRLINPPAWVHGIDITVRNIPGTISTLGQLGDTTHISKKMGFNNQGNGTYWFGINTFPSYPEKAASVNIDLLGTSETAPIVVEDERLHLLPGVITRLGIAFKTEHDVEISVEIDGKWEVIDGGNIII